MKMKAPRPSLHILSRQMITEEFLLEILAISLLERGEQSLKSGKDEFDKTKYQRKNIMRGADLTHWSLSFVICRMGTLYWMIQCEESET